MRRLTLVAVAAAYAAGCGKNALAPSSTVIPSAPATAGQAPPRIALTNFVAFGDSITWGEDGRNDSSEPLGRFRPLVLVAAPYPTLLQFELSSQFPGQTIAVANRGCRGELAGGGSELDPANPDAVTSECGDPSSTDRFHKVVVTRGYQAVLLMEGANDLGAEESGDDPIAGLRTMIEDAKAHGIGVFLATIPPEQPNVDPVPYNRADLRESDVENLNQGIRSLAASERVTLVDIYSAFPSPDVYNLYGLLSRDGLHPLEAGYELIAQTFFSSIVGALDLPVVTTSSVRH